MIKKYSRNKLRSFPPLALGIIMIYGSLSESNFILVYDGLFLIVGTLLFIIGIWGFITPIAVIDKNQITLKTSINKSITIDLESIQSIEFDKEKLIINFDDFKFNLKLLNPNQIEAFMEDVHKQQHK